MNAQPVTTLSRFACWPREKVSSVIRSQAEDHGRGTFLAVNSPHPLCEVNSTKLDVIARIAEPRELLTRFLQPNVSHRQLVCLGKAGSGKSHFIQWLNFMIPDESPDYVKVVVPRSGISLKGVIEKLLDTLKAIEPDLVSEGRVRASLPSDDDSPGIRRLRLATNIGLNLHALCASDFPNLDDDTVNRYVDTAHLLSNLFRDPGMGAFWTNNEGYIGRLIGHIHEAPAEYRPGAGQPQFSATDFPAGIDTISLGLGDGARTAYLQLRRDATFREDAVQLANRAIGPATMRFLNVTDNDLSELLKDIRRTLASRGKELIFLIEDFARMQYIDFPLLDALLVQASDESGAGLCRMRWAMAVTEEYYEEKFPAHVKQRMDFVVRTNWSRRNEAGVSSGIPDGSVSDDDVIAFVSKYLNALRLLRPDDGRARLDAWASNSSDPVPNACIDCPVKAQCHDAFGDSNGIGLYPFNRSSIVRFSSTADASFTERFNPREVLTKVIQRVLDDGPAGDLSVHSISLGAFPSAGISGLIGQNWVSGPDQQQLLQSGEIGRRQLAILGGWGGLALDDDEGGARMLPPGLWSAFDCQTPTLTIDPRQPPVVRPTPPTSTVDATRLLDLRMAIAVWRDDRQERPTPLDAAVANELRQLVYAAVVERISWAEMGMTRSMVAGDGLLFSPSHVWIEHQVQQPLASGAPLKVHRGGTGREAVALEALAIARYDEHQEGLSRCLSALSACLDDWAAQVIEGIGASTSVQALGWDPIVGAVSVLVTSSAMGLGTDLRGSSDDEIHRLAFHPGPGFGAPQEPSHPTWDDVFAKSRLARADAIKAVRMLSGAFKGSAYWVSPARTVRAIATLRQNDWEVPDSRNVAGLIEPLRAVAVAQRDIHRRLRQAVDERVQGLLTFHSEMSSEVGPTGALEGVIAVFGALLDEASLSGLGPSSPVIHAFTKALQHADDSKSEIAAQFQLAVECRASLTRVSPAGATGTGNGSRMELVGLVAKSSPRLHKTAMDFIGAANAYFEDIDAQVVTSLAGRDGHNSIELRTCLEEIDREFVSLIGSMSAVGSGSEVAAEDNVADQANATSDVEGSSSPLAGIGNGNELTESAKALIERIRQLRLARADAAQIPKYRERLRSLREASLQTKTLVTRIATLRELPLEAPISRDALERWVSDIRTRREWFRDDPKRLIAPDNLPTTHEFWASLVAYFKNLVDVLQRKWREYVNQQANSLTVDELALADLNGTSLRAEAQTVRDNLEWFRSAAGRFPASVEQARECATRLLQSSEIVRILDLVDGVPRQVHAFVFEHGTVEPRRLSQAWDAFVQKSQTRVPEETLVELGRTAREAEAAQIRRLCGRLTSVKPPVTSGELQEAVGLVAALREAEDGLALWGGTIPAETRSFYTQHGATEGMPLSSAWDTARRSLQETLPERVLELLARSPQVSASVQRLRSAKRRFEDVPYPPTRIDEVLIVEGYSRGLLDALQALYREADLTDEVRDFLLEMSSSSGAQVQLVTPAVQAWLRNLSLNRELRVRWGA